MLDEQMITTQLTRPEAGARSALPAVEHPDALFNDRHAANQSLPSRSPICQS